MYVVMLIILNEEGHFGRVGLVRKTFSSLPHSFKMICSQFARATRQNTYLENGRPCEKD